VPEKKIRKIRKKDGFMGLLGSLKFLLIRSTDRSLERLNGVALLEPKASQRSFTPNYKHALFEMISVNN
jgi:hypothetical protein